MDFYKKDNYTLDDIQALIENHAEENVHLEFKRANALSKENADKVTKTFSAFANSDGGIVIYGIEEKDHVASNFSFVDGNMITTEHISQLARYVQPSIEGLKVFPIRQDGNISKSIYVVQIPRSEKAPHMAKDHKYYKRNNVESIPMEDFDVKDVMGRIHNPKLSIVGCFLSASPHKVYGVQKYAQFLFFTMLDNCGRMLSRDYKLISYFFCKDEHLSPEYSPANYLITKAKSTIIGDMFCTKISSPSNEPIFPNEKMEFGHTEIKLPINEVNLFKEKAFVVSSLYWEGGGRENMLYFFNGNDPIYDKEEIAKYIPYQLQQYILG